MEKRGFFGWFNRTFQRGVNRYERCNRHAASQSALLADVCDYCRHHGLDVYQNPTSFLPEEDQGVLFARVQTSPAGSSAERTYEVVSKMRDYLLTEESDTV